VEESNGKIQSREDIERRDIWKEAKYMILIEKERQRERVE
jgi:hypothetical protein